jgi:tryprostatin B 6-hydroxylase
MRLVTARLVSKYHIRFPTGEDGHGVLGDLRDQFTANPGQLHLVFELREKQ